MTSSRSLKHGASAEAAAAALAAWASAHPAIQKPDALAAVTAVVLLATPLADTIGTLVRPFDPVAYALGLGVIVATCLVAAMFRRGARRTSIPS